MRFDGKVLIATGAGSGIAAATARQFASEGGRVAVIDRDHERAADVAGDLHGSIALACDVADEDQVREAVAVAEQHFGRIDFLVNAAGFHQDGPIEDWPIKQLNRMLAVHVGGTFLFCKHVLPTIRAQASGSIVNVSSIAALVAQPVNVAYGAAKGAILTLSRQLALDVAPKTRVNVVAPGRVRTGMTMPILLELGHGDVDQGMAIAAEGVLQKRLAEPEELAAPICFLLSDEASFITGSVLVADGGETAV